MATRAPIFRSFLYSRQNTNKIKTCRGIILKKSVSFGYRNKFMKTLYISDLDGTLLNEKAEISDFARENINMLSEKGLYFSCATARTQATVKKILSGVDINCPVILMNGVAMYDLKNDRVIDEETKYYNEESEKAILQAIEKYLHTGFIYTIENGELGCYYENAKTENQKKFIEDRVKNYGKKFTKVDNFSKCLGRGIIYYSIEEKKEILDPAHDFLMKEKPLHVEYYRDTYDTDCYFMEVSSASASKKNSILALKKMYGFDKVVSFGDNLNDLAMAEASDEFYAVENAKDEVKKTADKIIGSNTENGVVKFLLEKFNQKNMF